MRGDVTCRGEGVTCQGICDFFTKPDNLPGLKKWVDVETLPNGDELKYYTVKAPLCSLRDNVLKYRIDKRDDGSIFISIKSWTHPDYPETKTPIRAWYTNQAYIFPDKEQEGVFQIVEIIQLDLGGSLPVGILNGAMKSAPIDTNNVMMSVLKKEHAAK